MVWKARRLAISKSFWRKCLWLAQIAGLCVIWAFKTGSQNVDLWTLKVALVDSQNGHQTRRCFCLPMATKFSTINSQLVAAKNPAELFEIMR
jgi:hypothetical protein